MAKRDNLMSTARLVLCLLLVALLVLQPGTSVQAQSPVPKQGHDLPKEPVLTPTEWMPPALFAGPAKAAAADEPFTLQTTERLRAEIHPKSIERLLALTSAIQHAPLVLPFQPALGALPHAGPPAEVASRFSLVDDTTPAGSLGQAEVRPAAVCTVNSTADSGAGTLRQCMLDAGPGDTITFDTSIFAPSNPHTITLVSELPLIITDSLTIDASNAGVILDGHNVPSANGVGLVIWGTSGVTIRGLQITRFPLYGVVIGNRATNTTIGGSRSTGTGPLGQGNLISGNGDTGIWIQSAGTMDNTIRGNTIGTDLSGTAALGNGSSGVFVGFGATHNAIGGNTPDTGNLISGNGLAGVVIGGAGTSGNQVLGNKIGTDPSGTNAVPNLWGVLIKDRATDNLIGGDTPGAGNLISGNEEIGVVIGATGASGNQVLGNKIGTDLSGTRAVSNYWGVSIIGVATDNLIGGDTPGAGNLISGNTDIGVVIGNLGAAGNQVLGNQIGTDLSGTQAVPSFVGVRILNGATGNLIGGGTPGAGNLISGNEDIGVVIGGAGTSGNQVLGNKIGTDLTGTRAMPNSGGVLIHDGAINNLVGGDTPGAGNLISGNKAPGVAIAGTGSSGNRVLGNKVGTDLSGAQALGNGKGGIFIGLGASDNTIGGDTPGASNLISGNGDAGILLEDIGTTGNTIRGNRIGTDAAGAAALSNGTHGIAVAFGASANAISGNLVSGNAYQGIQLEGLGTTNNIVTGNTIGTDGSGTKPLGNQIGIVIFNQAAYNTIGGEGRAARNLISSNRDTEIVIQDIGTTGNRVLGNLIGTDATGQVALGNGSYGVVISGGATANTIGGDVPGAGNLISGSEAGICIQNVGTTDNSVLGNRIGTNMSGTASLSGTRIGVALLNGPTDNVVGGPNAQARNLISGSGMAGVSLSGPGTLRNRVLGNDIGTDASGTFAIPNPYGVVIADGATDNTIGGTDPGAGNLIVGNTIGLQIQGAGTMNNAVIGNTIGAQPANDPSFADSQVGVSIGFGATGNTVGAGNLVSGNSVAGVVIRGEKMASGNQVWGNDIIHNGGRGVYIELGAVHNTIGPDNTIAFNLQGGVVVEGEQTLYNTITRNVIHGNGGLSIDLIELPVPVAPSFGGFSFADYTVRGSACPGCRVELFANPAFVSAGTHFLDAVLAGPTGDFSLAAGGLPVYPYLAATATDPDGTTSEFSTAFAIAGSTIAPDTISTTVAHDITLVYTHTLTNIGCAADTFTLSATSDQGWLSAYHPAQIALNSGLTATVLVTVVIPGDLPDRVTDTTVITVTSALHPQAVARAMDRTVFERQKAYLPILLKGSSGIPPK